MNAYDLNRLEPGTLVWRIVGVSLSEPEPLIFLYSERLGVFVFLTKDRVFHAHTHSVFCERLHLHRPRPLEVKLTMHGAPAP